MRQRSWQKWELGGLFFAIGTGNLLHFVYEWCGEHPAAALISGINESTWEHMKLLAVPWLVWTAVELLVLWGDGSLFARAAGLLTGLVLIPALYYTYTGALGISSSLVNIMIFQLAVLAGFGVSWRLHGQRRFGAVGWQALGAAFLLAAAALFAWWTFAPPQLPLFVDPVTGTSGVKT